MAKGCLILLSLMNLVTVIFWQTLQQSQVSSKSHYDHMSLPLENSLLFQVSKARLLYT